MKRYFSEREGVAPEHLPLRYRLLAGATAGLSYWVGTYPLDVIKARMQSADFGLRLTWWQAAQSIMRSGGWRAFGQGLVPCAMRSIPACSSMFATVDFVRFKLAELAEL